MGNIMIGIKRFFKNKNTVTIFAILISLGILYWAYDYRIKKATEPVNVPYAVREIGPRTLITADMVSTRKVPGGVVSKNVLMSVDNIVGKYVLNTAVVPKNGLFYDNMVVEWEELPSSEFEDIRDGETVYALQVDSETTFGNSIYPNNYIDLYYQTTRVVKGQSVVWMGKFIESIRVLSVTDDQGKNVFETAGAPGSPSYLLFSVPDEYWRLLKYAERSGGTIFPVQRNADYSNNPKLTGLASSEIQQYIQSFAVSDDVLNIKDKKTGGNN